MIPLMKNAFLKEHETKLALADFIIKSDRLSMDEKCFEFERKFAEKQGRKHGILFNSGGSANLAMLQSLKNLGKLKDGDKVAFSALTWSTNTMPIIQMGLVPVPLDCELETLNVSSAAILERIAQVPDLKCIFLTNVLGFVSDFEEVKAVCDKNGIILIEDNCESLGTETNFTKAGNLGLGASFSFFVAHHMSTIEGGMITTDDDDFNEMLKIVRANGWDRNLTAAQQHKWRKKYNISSEFEAKYTFYDLGYNFRPTEITGFLGLFQLQFLDNNILKRQENYLRIEKTILENDDLIPLRHNHIKTLSTFAVPIICKTKELRERYIEQFSGAGVEIRPMIAGNMTKQPFYAKYVEAQYELPNTDIIHENGFYCGNYPELSETDLQTIESCLMKY
jgi:CDP-6-deoxy-D-xylo-4-hexulose-3-dehydrase